MSTLSVYMPVSHYFAEREFTVYEGLYNAVRCADEVSVVICDDMMYRSIVDYWADCDLIAKAKYGYEHKFKFCFNNWEKRMYPIMPSIQYNIALSHCTQDWCLRLDADEVIDEKVYEQVYVAINNAPDSVYAFTLGTTHFYGDYKHYRIDDPYMGHNWYDHKVRVFRNNMGIHQNKIGMDIDLLVHSDLSEIKDYRMIRAKVHHYGHVRSKKSYIFKKNWIEKTFHRDKAPIVNDYEFNMDGAIKYLGYHPEIMQGRIACGVNHEEIMEYYEEISRG